MAALKPELDPGGPLRTHGPAGSPGVPGLAPKCGNGAPCWNNTKGLGGGGTPPPTPRGVWGSGRAWGLSRPARGDSFLLKRRAGTEGLSGSPGREAGEGRGRSQSLDTSSLLKRFLRRSAPQTPEGIAGGGREGARRQARSPGAPRSPGGWREAGCPGKGRSRGSGVTLLSHKTGGSSGRPSASGFEVGDQRRGQGTASRRDPGAEARGAERRDWRPGGGPGRREFRDRSQQRSAAGRGAAPRAGGAVAAGPEQRDAAAQCPRRVRARGPGARTPPPPPPSPLLQRRGRETPHLAPAPGLCPGPSLPAWPGVEQRTGSEVLSPCHLEPRTGLRAWAP